MTSRTLAGLEAQITVPTDVIEYIHAARDDLSGTDYPGALALATALQEIRRQEGHSLREVRRFSAWFVIALEGHSDQASEAMGEILATLGESDFKKYW